MRTELIPLFEGNLSEIAKSLDSGVTSLLSEYDKLQSVGQKEELSHIYISFLLSSVLCKLPWLRIDLYDRNNRNDLTDCFCYCDVANVSNHLYDHVKKLYQEVERAKDYEIERSWLEVSQDYYNAFMHYMPAILAKSSVTKQIDCDWHFGQFLGNTSIVLKKSLQITHDEAPFKINIPI